MFISIIISKYNFWRVIYVGNTVPIFETVIKEHVSYLPDFYF